MQKLTFLKKITQGIILTLLLFIVVYFFNRKEFLYELLLTETLPYYEAKNNVMALFKLNSGDEMFAENPEETPAAVFEALPEQEQEPKQAEKIEAIDVFAQTIEIIGFEDVIFQPETNYENVEHFVVDEYLTMADIDKLRDLSYLRSKFYIVDSNTDITEDLFNVDTLLSTDLSMEKSSAEPKILIFHTHSQEMFLDSQDKSEGVFGVGQRLADILTNKYGIKTIHNTGVYDMVDGKSQIMGAYERMEPDIKKILEENPSIEMVIDLHRDGFNDGVPKQIVNIDGKPTATIMFVNGLTRLWDDGVLKAISNLPNPYLQTNLALSFQTQITANTLYPGFTRKVFLRSYRYSLHMMPKSLLVEVGSQFNTKEEALNAAEPLAEIIARVISK